ncbi:CocE/NonD family hydrolase [Amycolatopsis decaplanina]|uniref:X-Pro dipeptidyl-peptidase-like protein n=1 Tax=Amycolatopsis decaplanina DSM 44594 TaxID=1284240 RepID=M2YA28_9PSEU|nr:CocE/NonD family hydrolase [Amycolatopsis decaplanina]EME51757.1 X-Pro dipeptidyl-peptidase-like protein [Amycolatopsis decaplanina DSM 44594]
MNLGSHILQRMIRLPPPATRALVVQRDLRVPMPDGVELLADRWAPRTGGESLPTALIRGPYGRSGMFDLLVRPLAERGYQVLIQSVRGTSGSGGAFDPMRQEREDGQATLEWVVKQPWFGDSIVLVGGSYLGYVQWAVADRLPPEVKAMIPQATDSAMTLEFLRGDGLSLETPFGWGVQTAVRERPLSMLGQLARTRRINSALTTLPLGRADVAVVGHRVDYVQDVLTCDASHPRWAGIDHRQRVAQVTVPVSSVGGWYDIFLPGQIRDFRTMQDSGRPARLTIGPWTHAGFGDFVARTNTAVQEAVEFGLTCAHGDPPPKRAPVRLFVMGAEEWRDFDTWPPSGCQERRFHLEAGGVLTGQVSDESEPDRYRYDPADPTPAVGGVRMTRGGRVDNTALESRADVLTYTSEVLGGDVEVVGEVSAEIWFRSSLPYADVFVRLCEVDPRGRSYNICDGLTSLSGADEISRVTVRLWPTAYRFKRGHRIRVQVSSGAFPRYARNLGTGEPHATATTVHAAEQFVYHDRTRPSAVLLPIRLL